MYLFCAVYPEGLLTNNDSTEKPTNNTPNGTAKTSEIAVLLQSLC